MRQPLIVVAGATGDLGGRISRALLYRGAEVKVLVRRDSSRVKIDALRRAGATVVEVDYERVFQLEDACAGASCVVSALAGLRDVIVRAQTLLLDGAASAGVARFIPSDYCIDYTKLPPGRNRNLDLRRELKARLDDAPISATSILSGAFTDLLTGKAPLVLRRLRCVLYWGDADQRLDFTTRDDTAAFTAAAALESMTPRYLRIAGDAVSARDLARIAGEVSGKRFRLLRAGSLRSLDRLITVAKTFSRSDDALYPAWQGMQYTRDMFDGRGKLEPLDNARHPELTWTSVRDVLTQAWEARAERRGMQLGRP